MNKMKQQGPLLKWTNMMKGYQQRWFVLDELNGILCYYTSPEKIIRGERRGYIRLEHAIIAIEDEDDTTFSIFNHVDNKVFHCKANTIESRDEWINCLTDFKHLKYGNHHHYAANRQQISSRNRNNVDAVIEQFKKKLIETDQYLQILIKQFQILDQRIKTLEQSSNNVEDETLKRSLNHLRILRDRSSYFLDSIKHTIVLLQIAKNLKFPVNGIYPIDKHHQQKQLISQNDTKTTTKSADVPTSSSTTTPATTNLSSTTCVDNVPNSSSPIKSTTNIPSASTSAVEFETSSTNTPQTFLPSETTNVVSSSSTTPTATEAFDALTVMNKTDYVINSDDDDSDESDDYFFDANDESGEGEGDNVNKLSSSINVASNNKTTMPIIKKKSSTSSTTTGNRPGSGDSSNQSKTSEFDYDKIYDSDGNDNSDDDLSMIASHGSVISHLISQVKIGMDLTKVALPTFILERRSLLEMYADFFAHADLFCSIPDYQTPKERMIQVTKWYLSAFHAARKGSIAKKPYNPILGEVFKCYWSLDNNDNSSTLNDGPIPWAKTGDLIFVAEQVSHHPPISAFYAENVKKRIMCSAQIWTKSKFLGLSIGVNNIGQGSLYLLDHGEEYVCTFPSGYGRSILTEPWFEMGGSVQVECQKTGYSAKIDFLTKPFYGGKRHRIQAEVYEPNNKKVMVTITGEWNGKMEAKWSTGSSKTETFVDTRTMPIIKKQVKPISEQDDFESRNLWKRVTLALKRQDVNEASTAKYNIEQRQRDLVKEREENGIKWQNRYFHNVGDKWFYNNPLTKR